MVDQEKSTLEELRQEITNMMAEDPDILNSYEGSSGSSVTNNLCSCQFQPQSDNTECECKKNLGSMPRRYIRMMSTMLVKDSVNTEGKYQLQGLNRKIIRQLTNGI